MIDIQHVTKRFGRVTALDDASLAIEPGERIALVGSNGSGKTTLLRALLGLIRVQGSVRIAGIDVAIQPQLALRELAYVPQIAPPLEAPVREVMIAFAALRGIEVSAIAQRAHKLDLELARVLSTRFRDLSGGMRQKLLAAMALSVQPRFLICDEPTANLDPTARAAFLAELDDLPPGAIVVVCSHREEDVQQLVRRVVSLRDGRIERDERAYSARQSLLRAVP